MVYFGPPSKPAISLPEGVTVEPGEQLYVAAATGYTALPAGEVDESLLLHAEINALTSLIAQVKERRAEIAVELQLDPYNLPYGLLD